MSERISRANDIRERAEEVFDKRYEITDELGCGGMGKVYLAGEKGSGSDRFALKLIDKTDPVNEGEDVLQGIRILKGIKHPNIVAVRELHEDSRYAYILMDYIEGRSLADIRDNKDETYYPDTETVKKWMAGTADALRFIHGRGVIHRDIKPANIIIDSSGEARLIDFGISHRLRIIKKRHNKVTYGSAPYTAPEKLQGRPDGVQTDIYAYGVTFYSLLRRRVPDISSVYINELRTGGRSIMPYFMKAYGEMTEDLNNIEDDDIRGLIRSCLDIDPRKRIREFKNMMRIMKKERNTHE